MCERMTLSLLYVYED